MAETLKPCPFCGGEAALADASVWSGEVPFSQVHCKECLAQGFVYETEEEAASEWNRRTERTCQDVEGGNFFRCSKCGCELMRFADGWKPLYMGEVRYCPNCGARVEVEQ